ncbi:3-deoxy-D-manno-octulosonic acid transferase [hydrothermal vent metagenome]|uniref:3-deoxy-D-manno-octulosonic acid transferase n=1 Tax=hydrothermal vent metagenome TaxID=652676 RepID=A0A3B1A581_9ZZZZ
MNIYKILLGALSIPIVFYIALQSFRNKDYPFFLQRLAIRFTRIKEPKNKSIWIHAASVGEVNAATPLIHKLAVHNNIILTTNTPSSAIRVANTLSEQVIHCYCPIDWQWAVRKFISKFKPHCLLIIETELWPNLFTVASALKLPVTIINGRISTRTLHASAWMKKRYWDCLQTCHFVLTRSKEDSQRFIALGASASKVKTVGNIKFYPQHNVNDLTAFKTHQPYVLAASTRDDEEALIVAAWIQSEHGEQLLIIVPRHPKRIEDIINQLKPYNLKIAIRSRNDTITVETDVYIADTFGELMTFIKGATFVIMGGSFVDKGGQNILEVAHAGKTVVFGPFMDNFKEEALLFVEQQAGIQVGNNKLLSETINKLLNQPEINQQYQNNASQLMAQQQTVLDTYLLELQQLYPDINWI